MIKEFKRYTILYKAVDYISKMDYEVFNPLFKKLFSFNGERVILFACHLSKFVEGFRTGYSD